MRYMGYVRHAQWNLLLPELKDTCCLTGNNKNIFTCLVNLVPSGLQVLTKTDTSVFLQHAPFPCFEILNDGLKLLLLLLFSMLINAMLLPFITVAASNMDRSF